MSRRQLTEVEVTELTTQLVMLYKEHVNKRVRSIVTVLEKIIFGGVELPGVGGTGYGDTNGDIELKVEYNGQYFAFAVQQSSYEDRFWFSGEVYLIEDEEAEQQFEIENSEEGVVSTFARILEEVNEANTDDYEITDWELVLEDLNVDGFEQILQEGGGEGGAEYCFTVFKWKDKTYKVEYSYYSHHGFELDGVEETLREVKPQQKTVTVYE